MTRRQENPLSDLNVSEVYHADEPLWYLRLTAPIRLTWRRELTFVVTVALVALLVGYLLGSAR